MSKTKFTPGPWKSCKSHYGKGYRYVQLGEEDYTTTEMLPDDAYLVAAAPELYEALEELCRYAEDSDGCQYGTLSTKLVKDIAKAALAKARGET